MVEEINTRGNLNNAKNLDTIVQETSKKKSLWTSFEDTTLPQITGVTILSYIPNIFGWVELFSQRLNQSTFYLGPHVALSTGVYTGLTNNAERKLTSLVVLAGTLIPDLMNASQSGDLKQAATNIGVKICSYGAGFGLGYMLNYFKNGNNPQINVTSKANNSQSELSFVMIRPDHHHLAKEILSELDSAVSEFNGKRAYYRSVESVDRKTIAAHYIVHKDKPWYECYVDSFVGKPVVVALYVGDSGLIKKIRDCVGPTDPVEAPKNTIRGKFGIDKPRNVLHASDSLDSAKYETRVWLGHLMPCIQRKYN